MNRTEKENLVRAQQALSHLQNRWESQQRGIAEHDPLDYGPFLELCADDVMWWVPCPEETPVFGPKLYGRDKLEKLMLVDDPELLGDLQMTSPPEYFVKGGRVVALYAFSFRIKGADVTAKDKQIALVLDFRDGKIVRAVEIQDMSEWSLAHRS